MMKKLINFYKKMSFFQGMAFAIAFTSLIGIAATVGPMTTFTPGTVISSSQVNANFLALKTAVESTSSQTYVGTWNATSLVPDLDALAGSSMAGEYYVVTVGGVFHSTTYNVGDWVIYNGTTWGKIPSNSTITSVFGRTGVVAAQKGDYNLNSLADVNLTSPTPNPGDYLKFDGSQWRAGPVSFSETDPMTMAFAKTNPPSCTGGQFLFSNGLTLSCANAPAPFSGSPSRVVATDAAGNLTSTTVTGTEINYLSGTTSSIQSQINTKLNSAAFVDWSTPGVQTIDPTRIMISPTSRALVSNVSGQIIASSVTANELGYLSGVTSSINTQLINKASITSPTFSGSVASPYFTASAGTASNTSYRASAPGTGVFFPSGSSLSLATNSMEQLTITGAGNVGIGSITPASRLDVGNVGDAANTISVNASNNGFADIVANSNGNATIHMGVNFSGPTTQGFPNGTGGISLGNSVPMVFSIISEKMRIDTAGNVGIGNSTPAYKLDVTGDINSSGSVRAVGVALTSDKRLKKNIVQISNALEKLLGLRGVEFDWRNNNVHDTGVIAQEVEQVFPNLVLTDTKGMKSVKYANMAGVFIESTKELNAKVVSLEKENEMLKNYLCAKDPNAPFCE